MAVKKAEKKEDALTVDDAWLEKYVNFSNPAVKVTDVASGEQVSFEPVTDQADLSDVVEKQEEEAARLKKFADSPLPKTKDQIKQDKELNAALQRGKQQARNEQRLHERAKKMDAASDERVAKEKQRELDVQRKEAEREEDKRQASSVRDVRHVTQGINRALNENVNPLLERVGTLPTLGGIGLMLGILAFLLILIVPVNAQGDTRAKQFWYMLNGRAKLQGAVAPVTGSQVASGTSTIPGAPPTAPITIPSAGNIPVDANGNCPPGYAKQTDSSGLPYCQPASGGGLNGFRSIPTNLGF